MRSLIPLVVVLALEGCTDGPCTVSEECPGDEICVVGVGGSRCTAAPSAAAIVSSVRSARKGPVVLVEASTSALTSSSEGGRYSLRPHASVVRR